MMTDSDRMENVRVRLHAEISVSRDFHSTALVEVDRTERGCYTLQEAMELLRGMCDAVMSRCGERIERRQLDSRRRLEVEDQS